MHRFFRPRHLLTLLLLGGALALGGCVAYPAGYYGGPAYGYAGPPVTVGIGGGWGWWGGWHHDDDDWGGWRGGWHR
ncbi:MAG: hypothetical protein ACP5NP_01985 [Acetobacteraceae bacterium]